MKSKKPKKHIKTKGKGGSKGEKPLLTAFRFQGKVFFLTYKGISDFGEKVAKDSLANFLLNQNPNEVKNRPQKYLVCQQMYDSGQPHFHAILVYPKRKNIQNPLFYDYKGIHPNIQPMRNMKAALDYVYKQDARPDTNMDIVQQRRKARAKDSSSLYELLRQQMKRDPFHFNVYNYCRKHNLDCQIYKTNYTKAITLVNHMQQAQCRAIIRDKPGIKFITRELIRQRLTPEQLTQFYSHPCYQKIVDFVNTIYTYPNRTPDTRAPVKTRHLLIVGGPDIGKSALVNHRPTDLHPYPGLDHYYGTHPLGVAQKFYPPYTNYTFSLVFWNEFVVDSPLYPKRRYNQLLDYLDGARGSLLQKGKPAYDRQDNPRHILTSNRTLKQHVRSTFNSEESRAMALRNLPARIQQVCVPEGKDIHFLRKLFISA